MFFHFYIFDFGFITTTKEEGKLQTKLVVGGAPLWAALSVAYNTRV